MKYISKFLLVGSLILLACVASKEAKCQSSKKKMNVLFIAVDDLKPLLGTYGHKQMKTPNIDRLAKNGVQFNKAYCNVAVCGASRASIFTGVRPSAVRFENYAAWASKDLPGAIPLHRVFKENGYETISIGKIIHHPEDFGSDWDYIDAKFDHFMYNNPQSIAIAKELKQKNGKKAGELARQGPAYEWADVPDDAYSDGQTTNKAKAQLKKLKDANKPFFLAVGYIAPHLPYIAPTKYWDMYKPEDIKLADNPFIPKDADPRFVHNSPELRNMYTGIPQEGPMPDTLARKLVHGYYASVSYTDAMIGELYDELESLGLKDNTIVIFWSDHGYFLGQHTMWTKHSTFIDAINIPFMISVPGMKKGVKTESLAEYVDIYPTLCDLTGIKPPSYLDGKSLVPILKNPKTIVNNEIYTRYGNQEAVVNSKYSYMELVDKKGNPLNNMLYDLIKDPAENTNISLLPANKEVVRDFSEKLKSMRDHVNKQPF
jgi:arylsulfatase A-like enzyme